MRRPLEQRAGFGVMSILCNEVCEERTGVDEDSSHDFFAYISARCSFL
jgi:hypothetical protein